MRLCAAPACGDSVRLRRPMRVCLCMHLGKRTAPIFQANGEIFDSLCGSGGGVGIRRINNLPPPPLLPPLVPHSSSLVNMLLPARPLQCLESFNDFWRCLRGDAQHKDNVLSLWIILRHHILCPSFTNNSSNAILGSEHCFKISLKWLRILICLLLLFPRRMEAPANFPNHKLRLQSFFLGAGEYKCIFSRLPPCNAYKMQGSFQRSASK